jgi:putative ABC transport system ATP-binding protein
MTSRNPLMLEAKNISKVYRLGIDEIWALKNVSIDIHSGEFVAIIGKSGSGKSTLMHILGLLDSPTSGEIILDGTNTTKYKEKELAKIRNQKIGFVFQSFNLLSRTSAIDNVMLPLKYSNTPKRHWREKAYEMIKLVNLEDRMNNKSNELSGGQRQRVAIARALVTDPAIIFADEPTGNLDSKTGDEIIDILHELNKKGRTIVLVTHDEDIARHAQRRIVLKDGEVVKS